LLLVVRFAKLGPAELEAAAEVRAALLLALSCLRGLSSSSSSWVVGRASFPRPLLSLVRLLELPRAPRRPGVREDVASSKPAVRSQIQCGWVGGCRGAGPIPRISRDLMHSQSRLSNKPTCQLIVLLQKQTI
jgi:hypothetical protein